MMEVANPVQAEYSVLRPSLIVTILQVLQRSQHSPKPIKVFEVGPVAYLNERGEPEEDYRLAMAVMDDEVSYEDIQAPLYAMLRSLGCEFSVREGKHPALMEGRTAVIVIKGSVAGYVGEVKPSVLETLNIGYPVALAEVSLEVLARGVAGLEAGGKTKY